MDIEDNWSVDISVIYGAHLDIPSSADDFIFLHALFSFEPIERETLFCRAATALSLEQFDSLKELLHEEMAKRVHIARSRTIVSADDLDYVEYWHKALVDDDFMRLFQSELEKSEIRYDPATLDIEYINDRAYLLIIGDSKMLQQCFLRAANQILGENHGLHLIYRNCSPCIKHDSEADPFAWFICHKGSTIKPHGPGFSNTHVPRGAQCISIPSADIKVKEDIKMVLEALQLRIIGAAPSWMFLTVGTA